MKCREKVLIVNADDFGLDVNINQGIVDACRHGVVRSVSLVANGDAFLDALKQIKGLSGIGVGVHLCLTAEKPLLSSQRVSTLVNRRGNFLPSYREFLLRAFGGGVSWQQVNMELEAQVQRVLEAGIRPTHLDGHQYIHLFPQVLEAVIRLCLKYDIKWIRFPAKVRDCFDCSCAGWLKKIWVLVRGQAQSRLILENGVFMPDAVGGFFQNGSLEKRKLLWCLQGMPEGLYDFTSHPGFYPESLSYQSWGYHWQKELSVLTDPQLVRCLEELNIRLGNYEAVRAGV